MGGEHAMEHYDVCIGPNLTCMNDLMNRMGQFDHVEYKGKQVKCRSSCEDQVNVKIQNTVKYIESRLSQSVTYYVWYE